MKATFRTLFAMLIACLTFFGCVLAYHSLDDTRIYIDFSKPATRYAVEFRIYREHYYNLVASFQTKCSHDENDVIKYLYGISTNLQKNTDVRNTDVIPIHLLIIKVTPYGEEVIIDRNEQIMGITSVSDTINSIITGFVLTPGKYKMIITNIKSHNRLKYVPVSIRLRYFVC